MNFCAFFLFGALVIIPILAGTSVDTSGYTNPTGNPLPIDDKPKKSITIPVSYTHLRAHET